MSKEYSKIIDKKLVCSKCKTEFECTRKRFYAHVRKLKTNGKHYPLCDNCLPNPKRIVNCFYCKTKTSNPKFCSRSCAQSYNNKIKPKRLPIERTCSCGNKFIPKLKSSRRLCKSCQEERRNSTRIRFRTLQSYHNRMSVKGKPPSWKNSHIRVLNRSWNRDMLKQPCSNCGYNKHVELAHIRAVTDFPETATLGEVNSPQNNKVLCRNCHWEFDHGLLKL